MNNIQEAQLTQRQRASVIISRSRLFKITDFGIYRKQ